MKKKICFLSILISFIEKTTLTHYYIFFFTFLNNIPLIIHCDIDIFITFYNVEKCFKI